MHINVTNGHNFLKTFIQIFIYWAWDMPHNEYINLYIYNIRKSNFHTYTWYINLIFRYNVWVCPFYKKNFYWSIICTYFCKGNNLSDRYSLDDVCVSTILILIYFVLDHNLNDSFLHVSLILFNLTNRSFLEISIMIYNLSVRWLS